MKLIPVDKLPQGAVKEGAPMTIADYGGAKVQDYRHDDDLYEYVARYDGKVQVFKLVHE